MYHRNFNKKDSTSLPTLCPSGTLMIFYQKEAPKGWSILIYNDKKIICIKE